MEGNPVVARVQTKMGKRILAGVTERLGLTIISRFGNQDGMAELGLDGG